MIVDATLTESPASPREMDWSTHYPKHCAPPADTEPSKKVEFADIGCGFGGLLMRLAPLYPDTLMLGTCFSADDVDSRHGDPHAGHAVRAR